MKSKHKLKMFLCGMIGFVSCFVFIPSLLAETASARYRLQPSDVISITVHGHPDLTTKARVTSDGYITFPLVEKVYVLGLTIQELEQNLRNMLEKDYLVTAPVVAFIEEYHPRQVAVLGEVKNPGRYNIPEEKTMTLIEAIAMAGGFTKDALITKVKVIRNVDGSKKTMTLDLKDTINKESDTEDIILEPDDIVIVPESFF